MANLNLPSISGQKKRTRLEVAKDFISISQSLIIICSLISVVVWFFIYREISIKANISQEVTHLKLTPEWNWVNVTVNIQNVGNKLLNIRSGTMRIQKILPLEPKIEKLFKEGGSPIDPDELIVPWPRLGDSCHLKIGREIEPGETDNLMFEFIIPANIRVVKIYSYFTVGKSGSGGWEKATIYNLTEK